MAESQAVNGKEELAKVLNELWNKYQKGSKESYYLLFKNADQRSLFKIDCAQSPLQILYCDFQGRAATSGIRELIEKFFLEKYGEKLDWSLHSKKCFRDYFSEKILNPLLKASEEGTSFSHGGSELSDAMRKIEHISVHSPGLQSFGIFTKSSTTTATPKVSSTSSKGK